MEKTDAHVLIDAEEPVPRRSAPGVTALVAAGVVATVSVLVIAEGVAHLVVVPVAVVTITALAIWRFGTMSSGAVVTGGDPGVSGRYAFVSYARQDAAYVRRLVAHLRAAGVGVWMDDQIASGDRWDRVIRDRLGASVGVILVVSAASERSRWVAEEVEHAQRQHKPIFPLLLQGQVWFGLGRIQHEDVTGGRLPGERFIGQLRGLTASAADQVRVDQVRADPGGRAVAGVGWHLLPVPTAGCVDVGPLLAGLSGHAGHRIDVLVGPDDAGKSTVLRALARHYQTADERTRYLDLSLVNWREELLRGEPATVLLVDHIDRTADEDGLSSAFDLFDRVLPTLLTAGVRRVTIAVTSDWAARFAEAYRLTPQAMLFNATPGVRCQVHVIRPYDLDEITELCRTLGLDPADFADEALRRAGVLAMARSAPADERKLTASGVRDLLAARWIQAGGTVADREARRGMWRLLGEFTLANDPFMVTLSRMSSLLSGSRVEGRYGSAQLRAQLGGPLRWEAGYVQPDSPAWADLAAARRLSDLLSDSELRPIGTPLRVSVLDVLSELVGSAELAALVDRKLTSLAGLDFDQTGYLGPVLGTLRARLPAGRVLEFTDLTLQGPDHSEVRTIEPAVAATVEGALLAAMQGAVAALIEALRATPATEHSCFRGGEQIWWAARAWAAGLPLRTFAETALTELLPNDGSWRYEDILDVAVTGATTSLMRRNAEGFDAAVRHLTDAGAEYLADVWDGINDGAWDQIDRSTRSYVAAFDLPESVASTLVARGCRMQRAHLGRQDVRGWRLLDCELMLADFRSCTNVHLADFTGSNWWSAILPPAARYHLSRQCVAEDFLAWCARPPWINPYYTRPWPAPFA